MQVHAAVGDLRHVKSYVGTPTITTSTSLKATDAINAIGLSNSESITFDVPDVSDFWMQFHEYILNAPWTKDWVVFSSGGTDLFKVHWNGSDILELSVWNGAGWDTETTTVAYVSGTLRQFDIRLWMHDTTGVFAIYVDGVLDYTHTTTDTIRTAATSIDAVRIEGTRGTGEEYFSSIFVADSDTRNTVMLPATANAAGAHSDMTGAYTDIDETGTPNDTDKLTTSTAGDVSTFGKTALPAGYNSGYNVEGVLVSARAQKAPTSPQNLQLAVRSGTTDGFSGNKALDTSFGPHQAFFATDPNTAAAWTFANADACQIGVKAIA